MACSGKKREFYQSAKLEAMTREVFNTWTDYQRGVDTLLAMAQQRLCIYDPDLALLRLDGGERLEQLHRLLRSGRTGCVQIALRDANRIQQQAPRLMDTLASFGHLMTIAEIPETLHHLRDSIAIADGCHGLIRFDQDQARGKLLIDEVEETMPYQKRFDEIWQECTTTISPRPLGL